MSANSMFNQIYVVGASPRQSWSFYDIIYEHEKLIG